MLIEAQYYYCMIEKNMFFEANRNLKKRQFFFVKSEGKKGPINKCRFVFMLIEAQYYYAVIKITHFMKQKPN